MPRSGAAELDAISDLAQAAAADKGSGNQKQWWARRAWWASRGLARINTHAPNGDEIGWAAMQAQAGERHREARRVWYFSFRIFEARIIGTLFETNKKCYECFEENGVWA